MRRVAFASAGVVFRQSHRRLNTLLVSGGVVAVMSLWRAAAAVISDLCANYAQDFLNNWAGRSGEVLIIAGVLTAYAWHARRRTTKVSLPRQICRHSRVSRMLQRRRVPGNRYGRSHHRTIRYVE
jgi:hypothetical protein